MLRVVSPWGDRVPAAGACDGPCLGGTDRHSARGVGAGPCTPVWPFRGHCLVTPKVARCGVSVVVQPRRAWKMWREEARGSKRRGSELVKHLDQCYSLANNLPSSSWQEQVTTMRLFAWSSHHSWEGFPFQSITWWSPTLIFWGERRSSCSQSSYFLALPLLLPFSPSSAAGQPSHFTCAHCSGQELLPGGLTGVSEEAPAPFACRTR